MAMRKADFDVPVDCALQSKVARRTPTDAPGARAIGAAELRHFSCAESDLLSSTQYQTSGVVDH
jgi:hypothetical protein